MISMIACVSSNYALGNNNDLLFKIRDDFKFFQSHTKGNICLMGRKTFDSIIEMNGKPLSNRVSAVLTRDKDYEPKFNEIVIHDLEDTLKKAKTLGENDKKIYVCGGEEIYRLMLPYTDVIYLTEVQSYTESADAYFPYQDMLDERFVLTESAERYSEEYDCKYYFNKYEKN